jgi:hypothetical protein
VSFEPSPEPPQSAPRPGGTGPAPQDAYYAPMPQGPMPQGPVPPQPHPPRPWTGPGQPGGPPTAGRPSGVGMGAVAVIIGLLACVVPLLPFNVLAERRYVVLPLALGGLVLAAGAASGGRRGKPLAVAGIAVCALGSLLGLWMLFMVV